MENKTCRICGRGLGAPYRRYDERGHVVDGCVSMDHDGHLVTISESARWHNRKEAKIIRRKQAKDMIRLDVF